VLCGSRHGSLPDDGWRDAYPDLIGGVPHTHRQGLVGVLGERTGHGRIDRADLPLDRGQELAMPLGGGGVVECAEHRYPQHGGRSEHALHLLAQRTDCRLGR
jgi:hypothetical protein